MTTTPNAQPEHGQIISSPDPGWMTPWRRRAYKTRRTVAAAGRLCWTGALLVGELAVRGFIAWAEASIGLVYHFLALAVGVFVGVGISQPLVPTSWALHRTWEARYGLFGVWAIAGVLAALHNWYTHRTTTPTANLDDVAASYDELTDQIRDLTATVADLGQLDADTRERLDALASPSDDAEAPDDEQVEHGEADR